MNIVVVNVSVLFWAVLTSGASEDSSEKRYYGNYARPYYGVYSYPKPQQASTFGKSLGDNYNYNKQHYTTDTYGKPYSYWKSYYDDEPRYDSYGYGKPYYDRSAYGKLHDINVYDKSYDDSYSSTNYDKPYLKDSVYGKSNGFRKDFNGNDAYRKSHYTGNAYGGSYYDNNGRSRTLYNYEHGRPRYDVYGRPQHSVHGILILRPYYNDVDNTIYHT